MRTLSQLMSMNGRTAIVTGATGRLGRVICHVLAETGAELVLVDRPESSFDQVTAELAGSNCLRSRAFPCDLERQEDRRELLRHVSVEYPHVSVLVNNAALVGSSDLQGWATPFEHQSVETWRRALEVNLTAAFELSQGLARSLARGPGGSIINIASIYGHLGPDWRLYEGTSMGNPAAYAVSKGGLIQLSRWLATTLAPAVRVNSISPGGIFRNQPAAFVGRYESRVPLARMATEEDFKGIVAYLATDLSEYVTGQNFAVDGGWSAW